MTREEADKQIVNQTVLKSDKSGANSRVITVKNAEGDSDTTATILIQNKIDYTPKVSVIIPVYNVEQYLRECLDSVCNQTLREIEIICVDDGSTDTSLEILQEYANQDNRMTVIAQENLHAGVARNAGLMVAHGEYLSFLDSDDFFDLNMLEKAYKKSITDSADIVVFGYNAYDNETKKYTKYKASTKAAERSPFDPRTFANDILSFTNPAAWNKLFSANLFKNNSIRFINTLVSNDLTCVYTLLCMAKKISVIQQEFVTYRTNTHSNLSHNRSKHTDCLVISANRLVKNLIKLNVSDKYSVALIKYIQNSIVKLLFRKSQQLRSHLKKRLDFVHSR